MRTPPQGRIKRTDGSLRIIRITTSPDTNLDHHRSLRVLVAVRSRRCQNTDSLTIDSPNNLGACPVNGVGVKSVVIPLVGMKGTTIVAAGVAFAEVICLHLSIVAAQPFPINLVQVVGLQDSAADNTRSRRGFNRVLDSTEHDVPARLDQGPITLFGDCEGSSIGAIVGDSPGGSELDRRASCEIVSLSSLSERSVRGACYVNITGISQVSDVVGACSLAALLS